VRKTVVITGASGLLGRALRRELATAPGWTVRGTALRRAGAGLDGVNLRDRPAMERYLRDVSPDVVIHSAAERRPDTAEKDPEGTIDLNVNVTRDLVAAAAEVGAWVVFLSTDYVFDGTQPPYPPEATTCPLNLYGRTKCDAEQALRQIMPKAAVLRVPILYGQIESLDESAVTILAKKMIESDRPLPCDHWAIRYPTHVDDVAVVCRQVLERQESHGDMSGILHWSGDEPMTKYEMALAMAPILGRDSSTLRPVTNPPPGAPRPQNCHLDCARLESLEIGRHTPFAEAMPAVLDPHLPTRS